MTSGKSSDFLEKLKKAYEDIRVGDSFSIKFNGRHYDEESEEYPEEIAPLSVKLLL